MAADAEEEEEMEEVEENPHLKSWSKNGTAGAASETKVLVSKAFLL